MGFFGASVPALTTEVSAEEVEVEEKIVLQEGLTEHVAAEEAALGAAGEDKQGDKAWTKEGAREKGLIPKMKGRQRSGRGGRSDRSDRGS